MNYRALIALFTSLLLLTITAVAREQAVTKPVLSDHQIQMAGFTVSDTPSSELPGYRRLKRVLVMLAGDDQVARLSRLAPNVEFVGSPGLVPPAGLDGDFDAIILACSRPEPLAYANNAVWIHSYSVGVEKCVAHPAIKDSSRIITNSRGTTASIIGEHAIAMMLTLTRGLHLYRDAQRQAQWRRGSVVGDSITSTVGGKTMLVLGLGSIGREVARRANALGMRVTGTRNRSRSGPDYVDYVGLSDEALKLAKEADVVVNALPLTEKTSGLVDKTYFSAMKASALYISVGRGGTTNTADLLAALESGSIGGAGLDVTDPEPLPADHPLWKQPNVVVTPHIAATGGDGRGRVMQLMLENLRRYQAGEPLLNPVSAKEGY